MENVLQILKDFIFNSELTVDKNTFFTVIIGQIAMYGILLTFYQFVASYNESKEIATNYLGRNIIDYFIAKNMKIFNPIMSKEFLCIFFILEIMYKPVLKICEKWIYSQIISVLNFLWFGFVILYFITFVIIFSQCAKSIVNIKMCSDTITYEYVIRDINKNFLKKSLRDRVIYTNIEMLLDDFDQLSMAIQIDNNSKLQKYYNYLIQEIFADYIKQKQHEISAVENKVKIHKKRTSWIWTADCEVELLQEIIKENYFQLDNKNIEYIMRFQMNLLKLNLRRALLEGYREDNYDKTKNLLAKKNSEVFDLNGWEDIVLKLYELMEEDGKKKLIHMLYRDIVRQQDLYVIYCNTSIAKLIKIEINNIFAEKREAKAFVEIYGEIIMAKYINNFCTQIIIGNIICNDLINIEKIITRLDEENCTYLFTYIVIHYSIYKFRYEWKYINVQMLKALWKRHGSMRDNAESVIERIKISNIGHRFDEKMYDKLIEYIEADMKGELFNKIYKDNILNLFYIWVIKVCVTDEDDSGSFYGKNGYSIKTKINIINELAKREELMEYRGISSWVDNIRYEIFFDAECFYEKMKITIDCLLLTNINVKVAINHKSEKQCLYVNAIGQYLLIKLNELSDVERDAESTKKLVYEAFVATNMNVDEYINMLEKKCIGWKNEINCVQKQRMKNYVNNLITE